MSDHKRTRVPMHALLPLALAGLLTTVSAFAAPVTSLPSSTTYAFPALNYFGTGPQSVSADITWTSTNSNSVFGYTSSYGFDSNGRWDGLSMIGSNDSTSTMTLSFATPVSGVGLFLNYAPGYGTPVIAAYDSSNTLIESTVLSFATAGGTNQGEFHGFLEVSPTIAYFTLTGAYIGGANLEVTTAAVPEPETYAMLLAGLGVLGFVGKRRRQVS